MVSHEKRFIPRNEVAEMFGVTPQTVSNWFTDGVLQGTTIKGNRFATVESVQILMKVYPEVGPDANRIGDYRKKIEALQDELKEMKDNLRRERIYRHYAPRYIQVFVNKFINLMKKMVGVEGSHEPMMQEKFIHCWLFGHDIGELCNENNISHYKYIAAVKQYVKTLKKMDTYAVLVERNRNLEDEMVQLKAENERLKRDMDEYRTRYAGVENEERVKEQYPVLNMKIEDLDFTVRTTNILKLNNLETLGQVIKYDKFQLLKMRNFGRKCLTEILDFIEPYGLELGMNLDKMDNKYV